MNFCIINQRYKIHAYSVQENVWSLNSVMGTVWPGMCSHGQNQVKGSFILIHKWEEKEQMCLHCRVTGVEPQVSDPKFFLIFIYVHSKVPYSLFITTFGVTYV